MLLRSHYLLLKCVSYSAQRTCTYCESRQYVNLWLPSCVPAARGWSSRTAVISLSCGWAHGACITCDESFTQLPREPSQLSGGACLLTMHFVESFRWG